LAPRWPEGKAQVISAVERELRLRGSRQGSRRVSDKRENMRGGPDDEL
jgi:radical SAM superfamily enzyme